MRISDWSSDVCSSDLINAQDIVVTGSRVALSGFQAPSPTAVVGSEVIDRRAATTVMSVLNLNPAFKPTRSPGANATNTGSPAQATADLRSLGGQRTLVLVNGRRLVPSSPASTQIGSGQWREQGCHRGSR